MVMYMVKTPSWPVDLLRALLDRILDEADMSQAQLAALVPIDQSQLSRWKIGSSRPRFESLAALGTALHRKHPQLGIGPDDLLVAGGYKTEAEGEEDPDHFGTETISPTEKALNDQIAKQIASMEAIRRQQDELLEEVRGLRRQVDDLHRRQKQQEYGESVKRDTA